MGKLNRHRLCELQSLAQQGKTPAQARPGVPADDHHEDLLSRAVVITPAVQRRLPTSVLSTPLEARFDRMMLSGQRSALPKASASGWRGAESSASHLHESSSPMRSRRVPGEEGEQAVSGR